MSAFADLLNAPDTVAYKGKSYRLRELTLVERAMVSRRLEQRAEEGLGRAYGRMPAGAWEAWAGRVAADTAVGKYEWGGETYCQSMTTVDGMAYVCYLALRNEHEEVTEEFAATMVAELAGDKLLKELETIQGAGADPGNSSAPAGMARRGKSSKSSVTNRSRKRRKKSGK